MALTAGERTAVNVHLNIAVIVAFHIDGCTGVMHTAVGTLARFLCFSGSDDDGIATDVDRTALDGRTGRSRDPGPVDRQRAVSRREVDPDAVVCRYRAARQLNVDVGADSIGNDAKVIRRCQIDILQTQGDPVIIRQFAARRTAGRNADLCTCAVRIDHGAVLDRQPCIAGVDPDDCRTVARYRMTVQIQRQIGMFRTDRNTALQIVQQHGRLCHIALCGLCKAAVDVLLSIGMGRQETAFRDVRSRSLRMLHICARSQFDARISAV